MKTKIFNSNKITKSDLRTLICVTAKKFGVNRVIFSNKAKRVKGTYNAFTKNLYLDTRLTKKDMMHAFFHELGHHFAVKRNLWKSYHYCTVAAMSIERIFEIENGVDGIGQKLWHEYVNAKQWGRYKYSYPKSQKYFIIKNFISKQ
jgi:hypothetical protein